MYFIIFTKISLYLCNDQSIIAFAISLAQDYFDSNESNCNYI